MGPAEMNEYEEPQRIREVIENRTIETLVLSSQRARKNHELDETSTREVGVHGVIEHTNRGVCVREATASRLRLLDLLRGTCGGCSGRCARI